jgi:hypothetical protein
MDQKGKVEEQNFLNTSNINIVKIDKDKFISITKKKLQPIQPDKEKEKRLSYYVDTRYDLNDYGYDDEF